MGIDLAGSAQMSATCWRPFVLGREGRINQRTRVWPLPLSHPNDLWGNPTHQPWPGPRALTGTGLQQL